MLFIEGTLSNEVGSEMEVSIIGYRTRQAEEAKDMKQCWHSVTESGSQRGQDSLHNQVAGV